MAPVSPPPTVATIAMPLRSATVLRTWWPLAASWMLMGVEGPAIAAAISRLANPEIHLAALGGVVFPLALVIESPIIMMLAASTALCVDDASFRTLKRFMMRLSLALTLLHLLIVATPLFDLLALEVIGAPPEIVGPSRIGFAIMLPWSWCIADRRFHQGVLIRLGQQKQVGVGTLLRLTSSVTVLTAGLVTQALPGIALAGMTLTFGVLVEMAYARWCVAGAGLGALGEAGPRGPLTARRLWSFYVPLALTPLIALLSQPVGAAGISRMPEALASLAVWPALNGLSFLARSSGVAYNEVVVRHAGDENGRALLARMAWSLGGLASLGLALFAATPLAIWWFADLSGLDDALTRIASAGLWWAVLLPLTSYLHSYYQGVLVQMHRTRGITEAVAVFLVVTAAVLAAGVKWSPFPGASAAMAAMTAGAVSQTIWLAWRARLAVRAEASGS